jgi:DNA-binding transcriptional LysR family regulator
MDMRLDYLETFFWIGTLKSFADTAVKLNISQPTVSHRVKTLEQALNTTLIDRRGRRVVLTAAGARLMAEAPALLKSWKLLATRIGAPEPETGVLRIGVIESVLHSWLIPWIEQLRTERSGLELELTVETTPALLSLVERGAIDIIVAALAAGDGVRKRVLPSMPMVFVGKEGVHTDRKYTLAQLAQHDLLTFQVSSLPHSALIEQLATPSTSHARVHAISSISAMRALVASGFGVATLPRASMDEASAAAGLQELICETELAALPLCVSWRENQTRPHIREIVDSLERMAKAEDKPARLAHGRRPDAAKQSRKDTHGERTKRGRRARARTARAAERSAHAPTDSRRPLGLPHQRPRGAPRPGQRRHPPRGLRG